MVSAPSLSDWLASYSAVTSKSVTEPMPSQRGHMPPRRLNVAFSVFVLPQRSIVTAPVALTDGTLNEYALGEPMCGCANRLKRIRSIALASVAVPTVERGLAPIRSWSTMIADVRPRHRRHETLHERAVRLVDQSLRLGRDRAEHERDLPRTGDTGERRQS